jgi:phosphopantetheinyl transferase (holo-ACP synthase)
MYPEHNALAVVDEGGFVSVTEHWRGTASRELMMRRYLSEREREDHDKVGPRGRRGWLLGRIALKDAVRLERWRDAGAKPIWPVEIGVTNAPSGQPLVDGIHVSVSHKDDRAVAIVGARPVGIDLERIEPRTEAFLKIAFTPAELVLAAGRDEEYARLWAAKEAVAKALGTGMTDPKRFEVRAHGERLQIGDHIVDTKRDGDYMIAWTT